MRHDPCDWSFHTDSVDIAIESWERMLSENHLDWSVDELHWQSESFGASVRRRAIADLMLVDCVCDPSTGRRSESEIAATDDEYLILLLTLEGEEIVEQDGAQRLLTAGSAVIWDSTRPARYQVSSRLRKRSLLAPRAALAELGTRGRLRPGTVLTSEQPALRMLAGHLEAVSASIDEVPLHSIAAIRNATLELLGAALLGVESDAAPTHSVLAQAQLFIVENLRDPRLSPTTVAAGVGVSVRTLHRAFELLDTGVAEFIRIRRLAAARDDIISGSSITAAARRWQYSDVSHFTRAFRQQFGSTPGDFSRSGGTAVRDVQTV